MYSSYGLISVLTFIVFNGACGGKVCMKKSTELTVTV